MAQSSPLSFTAKWKRIVPILVTDLQIKIPESVEFHKIRAIWDTGATNCTITAKMATALGLVSIKPIEVRGVHGPSYRNTYVIDVRLESGILFEKILVTECDDLLSEEINCQMLIGMDIISTGELAITNYNNETCMSFRVPSTKCIDFAREDNARLTVEAKYRKK